MQKQDSFARRRPNATLVSCRLSCRTGSLCVITVSSISSRVLIAGSPNASQHRICLGLTFERTLYPVAIVRRQNHHSLPEPPPTGVVCKTVLTCPLGVLSAELPNGELVCHNYQQHFFAGSNSGITQCQPTPDLPRSNFRTDALPSCDSPPTEPSLPEPPPTGIV